jgi:hypothetical protein
MPDPVFNSGEFDSSGEGPTNADFARVERLFVGLANAFDFNDSQTPVGLDDVAYGSSPSQNIVWVPGVGWSVAGQPISSANIGRGTTQPAAPARVSLPVSWVVVGLIVYLVAKHA